ncbi:MAG: hypothetical protein JO026_00825 [Patescibacteria group bacterium]|nr:hypothetical protein [Patescibacteria group bacterium]
MQHKISDEAVKKATGKNWKEWSSILDKAGAKKMPHKDIARFLYDRYFAKKRQKRVANIATSNGWWAQMITVEYERARGMRSVNQNASGFLVSVHRTVKEPLPALMKKWNRLAASKTVALKKLERLPSRTKRDMMRYKAKTGGLVVSFDKRSPYKSRIVVEAIRLSNAGEVERERKFWKEALKKLN